MKPRFTQHIRRTATHERQPIANTLANGRPSKVGKVFANMTKASGQVFPLLMGLLVVSIWGLNFPLQKAIFGEIDPVAFVGLRYLIVPVCAVLLLLWHFGTRWPGLAGAEWFDLARLALIGQALHLVLAAKGLDGSTAFSASVLLACGPVFTLLILRVSGLEKLSSAQVAGVALAGLGALLFTADKLLHANWRASGGDAVLLVAASLFSYYTVASKPLIARHGGVVVLAYGTLLCTVPVLVWIGPELSAIPWRSLPSWVWVSTLWNVVGGGFLGWLVWGYVNERRGVARTAPLIYLMPLVAGVSSWALANERFSLHKLFAACVVLVGVALAQFGARVGSD
jgi:drug/metabolite transporter (DMT)-like permease